MSRLFASETGSKLYYQLLVARSVCDSYNDTEKLAKATAAVGPTAVSLTHRPLFCSRPILIFVAEAVDATQVSIRRCTSDSIASAVLEQVALIAESLVVITSDIAKCPGCACAAHQESGLICEVQNTFEYGLTKKGNDLHLFVYSALSFKQTNKKSKEDTLMKSNAIRQKAKSRICPSINQRQSSDDGPHASR
ncbi:unnamed protein product [Leptosia nina]|uniref:Uncharacterized protein n=1 Tax=Leptosia nina TaxID=320188 RepID=A0AAV1JV27_9NEOP